MAYTNVYFLCTHPAIKGGLFLKGKTPIARGYCIDGPNYVIEPIVNKEVIRSEALIFKHSVFAYRYLNGDDSMLENLI